MTRQPARHEYHACYPLQAGKPGMQPVVGNTHGTHVELVVSSFQKILRDSQLTWYVTYGVGNPDLFSIFLSIYIKRKHGFCGHDFVP